MVVVVEIPWEELQLHDISILSCYGELTLDGDKRVAIVEGDEELIEELLSRGIKFRRVR